MLRLFYPYLARPLPLDLIFFDVPDQCDETDDMLKPEVVRWLAENCHGQWAFRKILGPEGPWIDDGGEAHTIREVMFGLAFADRRDFEAFQERFLA